MLAEKIYESNKYKEEYDSELKRCIELEKKLLLLVNAGLGISSETYEEAAIKCFCSVFNQTKLGIVMSDLASKVEDKKVVFSFYPTNSLIDVEKIGAGAIYNSGDMGVYPSICSKPEECYPEGTYQALGKEEIVNFYEPVCLGYYKKPNGDLYIDKTDLGSRIYLQEFLRGLINYRINNNAVFLCQSDMWDLMDEFIAKYDPKRIYPREISLTLGK